MEFYLEAYNYIDEAEKDLEAIFFLGLKYFLLKFYEKTWEAGEKAENNEHFLNEQQRLKDTPPTILRQEIMLQK